MTIEASLERIAIAIEAIVESQGIVAGTIAPKPAAKPKPKPKPEPSQEALFDDDNLDDFDEPDLEDDLDVEDVPAAPKKVKKKPAKKKKKKAATKTKVGTDDETFVSEDDVREKLKALQITSGDARMPKSILKRNGASTLKQLEEGKRGNVIAEIDAELAKYE
jgi:hypothetical protein